MKKPAPLMRATLQHIVQQFDPQREMHVLFTSFTFSSRFFEANVIPLLLGEDLEEFQGGDAIRQEMNQRLKKVRCVVACDRSANPEPKGDLRYGLLPVRLRHGRFHPKIMLISGVLRTGGQGLWLSVASGNLTLSGWGINREVVAATRVNGQHADALKPLLQWLREQVWQLLPAERGEEEGQVDSTLVALQKALGNRNRLAGSTVGAPSLHLALPAEVFSTAEARSLMDVVRSGNRWRNAIVVSPYWSNAGSLMSQLPVEYCTFVPTEFGGDVRFPINTLSLAQRERSAFAILPGEPPFSHAKCIWLGNEGNDGVLYIGSANFTHAALCDNAVPSLSNIEAILRYEPMGWSAALQAISPDKLAAQPDDEEENAPPLPPFDAVLHYDWKAGAFGGQIFVPDGCTVRQPELMVAGITVPLSSLTAGLHHLRPTEQRLVQPVRSFSITYRNDSNQPQNLRGLVIQVNAHDDQLGYEQPPVLKDLLAQLCAVDPSDDPQQRTRRQARTVLDGDGEETGAEPDFDFYALFQASWNLQQSFSAEKKQQTAHRWLVRLYRAIHVQPAQSAQEQIGRFVQLAELQCAWDGLAASGFLAPDDADYRHLAADLADLRPEIEKLLRGPGVLRDRNDAGDAAAKFLDWFDSAMAERNANGEG
ncbi:hypothetical protein [Janthinobacterium sp. SUN137]|uniref:hypothetical protein n=1 Tax=Janthinobacterium sp. SUN137 TaxID=3014789 RepID=UPI002713C254|nr:hypothetical protein [Janthinobacterium sp. SUN137]MDO8039551.1 hypothetical protein [Janthinobacterium sp. SUN137]